MWYSKRILQKSLTRVVFAVGYLYDILSHRYVYNGGRIINAGNANALALTRGGGKLWVETCLSRDSGQKVTRYKFVSIHD